MINTVLTSSDCSPYMRGIFSSATSSPREAVLECTALTTWQTWRMTSQTWSKTGDQYIWRHLHLTFTYFSWSRKQREDPSVAHDFARKVELIYYHKQQCYFSIWRQVPGPIIWPEDPAQPVKCWEENIQLQDWRNPTSVFLRYMCIITAPADNICTCL